MSKEEIKQVVKELLKGYEEHVTVDISGLPAEELKLLRYDLDRQNAVYVQRGAVLDLALPQALLKRHSLLSVLRVYRLEVEHYD